MTHTIRVTHRTSLPGVGNDRVTGVAANSKQMIVGVIDITLYTSGGEVVRPEEFGVSQIDYITFGPLFEQTTAYNVRYEHSTYEVHVTQDSDADDSTSSDDYGEIGFLCIGDSVARTDLL